MRGLFVCPISADLPGNRGILNKMESERAALAALAGQVDVVLSGTKGPQLGTERFVEYPFRAGMLRPLNHYFVFYRYVWTHCSPADYDFLYIRYPFAIPAFLRFLSATKAARPDIKVIVEVPTYPYRREFRSPKQRVLLALDDLGTNKLKNYVDLIVTFFGQREIFGIPCFRTANGIDVDRIPQVPKRTVPRKAINLIAVANLARWHGIDRLLRGLADHQRAEDPTPVTLDVVGAGPAEQELADLADTLGLNGVVTFHGMRSGAELDALFADADLAAGSLGMHRLSLARSSSLKVREYCARGVPFMLGSDDPDFPTGSYFVHRVPANDDAIDIARVANFVQALREEHPDHPSEMRAYAQARLTWKAKLAPVVDFVKTGELPP